MEFFEIIWIYILVFLLGATPFAEAIFLAPIGIIAGLSPVPTLLLSVTGNLLTVYLVILFIEKIKEWWSRRKKTNEKKSARAKNVYEKYGLPGLTLLGPFIIGSHLSAFLSLLFGGTKSSVTKWMTISIAGWSLLLTILAALGFDFMNVENPLIDRLIQKG